jgi:hypothetical protein
MSAAVVFVDESRVARLRGRKSREARRGGPLRIDGDAMGQRELRLERVLVRVGAEARASKIEMVLSV